MKKRRQEDSVGRMGSKRRGNLGLTLQLEKCFPKKRDYIVGRGIGARGSPRKDFLAPKYDTGTAAS